MQYGPNPNAIYPNEAIKSVCYIKNIITRPNITVGEYSYYDDVNGAEKFEEYVTHHYEFIGDKLIIGKFCAFAKGIPLSKMMSGLGKMLLLCQVFILVMEPLSERIQL